MGGLNPDDSIFSREGRDEYVLLDRAPSLP